MNDIEAEGRAADERGAGAVCRCGKGDGRTLAVQREPGADARRSAGTAEQDVPLRRSRAGEGEERLGRGERVRKFEGTYVEYRSFPSRFGSDNDALVRIGRGANPLA